MSSMLFIGLSLTSRGDGAMLVLNRKKDESVKIGDDITIMVLNVQGGYVRLGIEAPKEVPVHRKEVYDAIYQQEHEGS